MILFDVNVFVNAHLEPQEHHEPAVEMLEAVASGATPHALSELVLSSFVRIVTSARTVKPPTSPATAFGFCADLLDGPNARLVAPGPRHWAIFRDLCERTGATGPLVADAYLAALAIEHGCELVSFDRDFARFPGLRWHSPLDA